MTRMTTILIQTSPASWVPAYKISTFERDGRTWTRARTEDGTTYVVHPDKVLPDHR